MRRRAVVLGLLATSGLVALPTAARAEPIQGAGSTFAAPLITRCRSGRSG